MAPYGREHVLDDEEIPSSFLCPITHELMQFPLMSRSGLSYERSAILTWLAEHNGTCPLTRQPLSASSLVPNNALRSQIQAWVKANDIQVETSETDNAELDVFVTCMAFPMKDQTSSVTIQRSERRRLGLSMLRRR